MDASASRLPVLAVIGGAGILLAYSGIKGKGVSSEIRALLHGQSPTTGTSANAITTDAVETSLSSVNTDPATGGTGSSPDSGTASSSGTSNSQNRALAQKMCAAVGWTSANGQWQCFDWVAEAESGYNDTILNTGGSGAAGIAQNIKGFGPGYEKGNAAQQLAWMISYIQGRYGNPCAAKSFHISHNWY
jgi:hypothetical protein